MPDLNRIQSCLAEDPPLHSNRSALLEFILDVCSWSPTFLMGLLDLSTFMDQQKQTGHYQRKFSVQNVRVTDIQPLFNTPLIIHHSSYTTHHTPILIHHSSYTTHHTPLIIHHISYTTHQTPLIIHHSSYTTHHTPLIIHHSSHTT